MKTPFERGGILAAALLALLFVPRLETVAAALPSFDRVRVLESPRVIEDAALTDQNGAEFRISQLKGRVALVLFGYTNCPDVCPIAMENLRQLRESGRVDPARVAFVMISVDGERDTPEVMKAYVESFSPDFIGLTAAPAEVKPLAKQFSAMFFMGGHDAAGHYTVAHTPQVFVLDPDGQLRAEFYSPSVEAMSGLVDALLEESR
jgi:protein SCO1